MINVYFAGSILGGTFEGKRQAYDRIIQAIKNNGLNLISQHGAVNPNSSMENLSDRKIYSVDIDWLDDSNILIAEVTAPSTGVGFEIGYAIHKLGIPVLCLHREGIRPSAMVGGNPNCMVLSYNELSDMDNIVREFVECVHG